MNMYSLVDESVRCAMNIKTHKCRKSQCQSCSVWQSIQECSKDLDKWDKLEVQRLAKINFANKWDVERSYNMTNRVLKFLLVLFIAGTIFCFGAAIKLSAEPVYVHHDYYVNDGIIRDKLRSTHRHVHDRDVDGLVNCIDYTLTFKEEWDKDMPPNHCQIVRNYQKTVFAKMNHLFVRVKLSDTGKWLYIEPQAKYERRNYKMSDYWGWPKYNPQYNKLGETVYWMSLCRR